MLGLNFSNSYSQQLDHWIYWAAAKWLADLLFVLKRDWTGVPNKVGRRV